MKEFLSDRNYLRRYFVAQAILFSLLAAAVWAWRGQIPSLQWSLGWLALVPVAVWFGLVAATAFHNTSHFNIAPRALNEAVGEILGAYMLDGLRNFRVVHTLHHMYADDPVLDPHCPGDRSFGRFLWTVREQTIAVVKAAYYRAHGDTAASRANTSAQIAAYYVGVFAKLAFWWGLFGSNGFVYFYLPSYLSYVLGFGHLNWAAHRPDTGEARACNLSGGLYYRVMNFICADGYYHGDHHRSPRRYNPKLSSPRM